MSRDIPPAPPEAGLIRLAREALDMTAQDASDASKAYGGRGVSAAYWRDVERGRGGRRGKPVPVRASDRALASMAWVVDVTPDELTRAGRGGAAQVLEEILRNDDPGAPPRRTRSLVPPLLPAVVRPAPRAPGLSLAGTDPEAARPFVQGILTRIYSHLDILGYLPPGELPHPDQLPPSLDAEARASAIPGRDLFDDVRDAGIWGNAGFTVRQRIDLIAWGQCIVAKMEQRENRQTGLHRSQFAAAGHRLVTCVTPARIPVAAKGARASH